MPERVLPTGPFKFLLFVLRPYAGWYVATLVVVLSAQTLASLIPFIFQHVIDAATTYGAGGPMSTVVFWVALYPATVLVGEVLWRVSGYTGWRASTGVRATAHTKLFEYLSLHSNSYFANRFAGALTSNITNVTSGVGDMLQSLQWQYIPTLLGIVISFILAWTASPLIAGIFAGWFFFLLLVNYVLMRRVERLAKGAAEALSKLRGTTVDILSNIVAVQQFANRNSEVGVIGRSVEESRQLGIKSAYGAEWVLLVNSLLISAFVASIVFVSLHLWQAHTITLGQFILVFTVMANLIVVLIFIGHWVGN